MCLNTIWKKDDIPTVYTAQQLKKKRLSFLSWKIFKLSAKIDLLKMTENCIFNYDTFSAIMYA